jgi:hypothetical protein
MVTMERSPGLDLRSGIEAELRVDRTEIVFHDLSRDTVQIQVTVHNDGGRRSLPTLIRIESAPLGAFAAWRPLTQLLMPALEPGESRELTADAARPHPAPLGDFDHVPPQRLIMAVSAPDQPSSFNAGFSALLDLFRRRKQARRPASGTIAGAAALAPDIWDWLGRSQPHWAGNINVFVGRRPVERHVARALRIHPGRTNLAMFVVGSAGTPGAYAFKVVGLPPDWKAALFDVTNGRTLGVDPSCDAPIEDERWVEAQGMLMLMLAAQPPPRCRAGKLEVHVARRGSPRPAIVEFDLDPKAQGAGCFFV